MLLFNNVHKESVKITLAVKVYADGDVSRSMFDDLLGEDALAKTGETTVRSSMIKNLGLDFSYNEKNYKCAISDIYNQLQDLYKDVEIIEESKSPVMTAVYVRDDDATKVNVGQIHVLLISFVVDICDADNAERKVIGDIITTFDFNGIYVDYDEDFIEIETKEI
jgi:hypothetical protein